MKKIILVVCIVMVVVLLATMFVACSAEDYAKKLEKKHYKTVRVTGDNAGALAYAMAGVGAKGDVKFIVSGTKDGFTITYIKFEKSSDAKIFTDNLKKKTDIKISRVNGLVKLEKSE